MISAGATAGSKAASARFRQDFRGWGAEGGGGRYRRGRDHVGGSCRDDREWRNRRRKDRGSHSIFDQSRAGRGSRLGPCRPLATCPATPHPADGFAIRDVGEVDQGELRRQIFRDIGQRYSVASPMPEAAPVTMTTFPSKRFTLAHFTTGRIAQIKPVHAAHLAVKFRSTPRRCRCRLAPARCRPAQ
jgi:hypothetical protein